MKPVEYTLDASPGTCATLGLIVLQVDETIESDFRRLLPDPRIALHVARLPSGSELTQDSIAEMKADLPHAASLLPQQPDYNAVAYACTSGATLLGPERVRKLVRQGCTTTLVLDPLSAVLSECDERGIKRLGMVSPYTPDIGEPVAAALRNGGIEVVASVHFGEAVEANVARISGDSVRAAAEHVSGSVDGVFLSCTNLRTLDLIAPLEQSLGVPVLSSNLSLARAMARAAGTDVALPS